MVAFAAPSQSSPASGAIRQCYSRRFAPRAKQSVYVRVVADIDVDLAAFTKAQYRTQHGAILPRCCGVHISPCWNQREQRNTADHREYRSIEKYCAMANMIP